MKITNPAYTKIINPAYTEDSQSFYSVEAFRMEDGKVYNFADWNGEKWYEWWEDGNPDNCGTDAIPVYVEYEDGDYELIGIDF